MHIYKITVFGHRDLHPPRQAEERLYRIMRDLIRGKSYVEIYIGRNGVFDTFAASTVKNAQKAFGKENSALTLILPYAEKDIAYYEQYYDSIIIPECVEKTHPKGAIAKRNRWMVRECDLFICYVVREHGGAHAALKYAKKLGKIIINLADGEDQNS